MDSTLPYDVHTENVVLGCVISYPEEYDSVTKYFTNVDVFYQIQARLLWGKLKEMKYKGQHIDTVTVCSAITKKDTNKGLTPYYITECTSALPLKGRAEIYASKLYEKYLLRRIIVKAEEIKTKARDNENGIYKTINEAHLILSELINMNPSEITDIDSIINETVDSFKNKKNRLISTGYKNIDKFAGGLTRGEITIIGGRPGHGKTTVMVNMLANMLSNGHKAIFFSRELPNSELFKKILCLESQQLSYGMVRKNVFTDTELRIMDSTMNDIRKKYSSDKFLMFDNIRDFELASGEVKKFKPDIIFDDYIQLIYTGGRDEDRRHQIERLVNNYKWLAKDTGAVVVLASQLNRYIERNSRGKTYEPQLSDLAESGAIEQVAENVFFSYYDYKVKGENAKKGKNSISIIAGKVRYGDSGYADLGYDGDKCKIYNSLEEIINNDTLPFP